MNDIVIYTDGACSGNPGPGGYGAVLISDGHRKELAAGYRLTTNNRMEILASIAALEALKQPSRVTLYTDSKYLCDAIMKGWAIRWKAKGWMRNNKDKAKNPDLWERLLKAIEPHDVTFEWVKGHANIPENERCDELAVAATHGHDLAIDEVYEHTQS